MTHYMKMEYDEFHPFAEAVAQKAIADELSSVIIEKKSQRVVALSLVEDLLDPVALNMPLSFKFDPILALLERLSSDYFAEHTPSKNQIAHLFISAVAENFRNLRLSTHANFHAMRLAKQRKFSLMLSELTNYLNEKGIVPHLKGEKKCVGEIVYHKFEFNNQRPFMHLEGMAHSYLWELPEIIKEAD